MRDSFRFSIIVFGPLLAALIVPAVFLMPSGLLMGLIALLDPTVPASEGSQYSLWVYGPMVAAVVVACAGMGMYRLWARAGSRKGVWAGIWLVFSAGLFVAVWYAITLLTGLGASDYPANEFVRWTARTAAWATLALQPGVGLWLYASSRML